tara:strand:- start:157 stop:387 length:231 start_codon:yes stop_codon:yes gene_type:complete
VEHRLDILNKDTQLFDQHLQSEHQYVHLQDKGVLHPPDKYTRPGVPQKFGSGQLLLQADCERRRVGKACACKQYQA